MNPATIKLFLPNGDSQGLRIAEISNWSGIAVAAPRVEIKTFLKRAELGRSGVYFLIGYDAEDNNVEAYIGEGEILRNRIKNPYGANIRTSRMILLSSNITDNLFGQ